MLKIKNNAISEHSSHIITALVKSKLKHLDISENPLGHDFYKNLPSWKQSSLESLNISATSMDSEALIVFLINIEENKNLHKLKADKNDLSHHWFSQMRNVIDVNSSLESLSLFDCNILTISSLFEGLTHNKYIKKLNISNNLFDDDYATVKNALANNKFLEELRMKFCGVN